MIVAVTPSDPFVSAPTGTQMVMHVCWERMVDDRVMQYVEGIEWMDVYRHLPLATMDERVGFRSEAWRRDLEHPLLDEYWKPLCYQGRLGEIDLPVLHITGWYDDELATPSNFAAMTAPGHPARDRQRLLVGPWPHTVYRHERQLGDVDFSVHSLVDLHEYGIRWLDHVITGVDNDLVSAPRVRIFVMGSNEWRDEHE